MKPSDVSILVVDDEQQILDSISQLFTNYGFKVDCATSGNFAWELIQKSKYHVVFSDIKMTDGDGIELIKKIKSKYGNDISVLFMSGYSDLQNEEVYHIGAEGKFSKPFDANAARVAIEQSLMAPFARWSMTNFEPDIRATLIEKSGADIKALKEQKLVYFGRGGFFISHNFSPPTKGSMVRFSIKVNQPNKLEFEGYGIVRWIQSAGKPNVPPGLGIEIINMNKEAAKLYTEMFRSEIPFIPSFSKAGN